MTKQRPVELSYRTNCVISDKYTFQEPLKYVCKYSRTSMARTPLGP